MTNTRTETTPQPPTNDAERVVQLEAQLAELQAAVVRLSTGDGPAPSEPTNEPGEPGKPVALFHFDRADLVHVEPGSTHERLLGAAGYVAVAEMASDGLRKVAKALELGLEGKPRLDALRSQVLDACADQLRPRPQSTVPTILTDARRS